MTASRPVRTRPDRAARSALARLALAALVVGAAVCWPLPDGPVAHAQQAKPPATASAKTLFRAGAEAYAENNFLAALHAFGAARAIVPDPALTFSIAQAHRRQYYVDQRPYHLRRAVTEYKRYLTEVEKGGRRADAQEAIDELEPKVAALTSAAAEAEGPARIATRLMVLSSVDGALVTVDGGPEEKVPFIGEIEPGTHQVRVTAAGYQPYERSVLLGPGNVLPIDAELRDLPARLLVQGEDDAVLWIDGRSVGPLPLAGPVPVSPGRRLVAVTKDGYRRYELETRLERGEQKELAVTLESTAQRTFSVVSLAIAGTCLVAGGVFAGVAGGSYASAESVYDQAQQENISPAELEGYNASRSDYQPWTVAAIATGAVGGVLGLTGALLFLVDEPAPPSQVAGGPSRRLRTRVIVGAGGPAGSAGLGVSLPF